MGKQIEIEEITHTISGRVKTTLFYVLFGEGLNKPCHSGNAFEA